MNSATLRVRPGTSGNATPGSAASAAFVSRAPDAASAAPPVAWAKVLRVIFPPPAAAGGLRFAMGVPSCVIEEPGGRALLDHLTRFPGGFIDHRADRARGERQGTIPGPVRRTGSSVRPVLLLRPRQRSGYRVPQVSSSEPVNALAADQREVSGKCQVGKSEIPAPRVTISRPSLLWRGIHRTCWRS